MKKVFFVLLLSPLGLLAQKKTEAKNTFTITISDTAAYRLYSILAVGQKYFAQEVGKKMTVDEFANTINLSKEIMEGIVTEDKKWHPVTDSLKNKK